MILKLQKRHRLIWALLAILLPIGFVSAYLAIPADHTQPYESDKLEAAQLVGEDELASVYFNPSTTTLQVALKQALTTPSTTLFLSNNETIKDATLLGNLSSKKAYLFNLKTALTQKNLLFYDGIKKEVYHQLLMNE